MKTQIRCNNCGNIFSGDSSWRGGFVACPYCQQPTFYNADAPGGKANNRWLWLILGGIGLLFILLICVVSFATLAEEEYEYQSEHTSSESSSSDDYPTLQGEMAKRYIENELPSEQRAALMGHNSNPSDTANAIANLLESNNLQGASEYVSNSGY